MSVSYTQYTILHTYTSLTVHQKIIKSNSFLLMSMAETEQREVQDVIEELDKFYNTLSENLGMAKFIKHYRSTS